jgi:hypothetical protein
MISVTVDTQRFEFPNGWQVSQPDAWSFYRKQYQRLLNGVRLPCPKCGALLRCSHCNTAQNAGGKALDLLAIAPNGTVWLIEVKDYRRHRRTKPIDLADEVALKIRDSLAAIMSAAFNANDPVERAHARSALQGRTLRVVLHLEQPAHPTKLFPQSVSPAFVEQRLRQLVKAIDPHPCVLSSSTTDEVDWTVT